MFYLKKLIPGCIIVLCTFVIQFGQTETTQDDFIVYEDPNSCSRSQNLSFSSIHLGCIDCSKGKGKNSKFISVCPCPPYNVKHFLDHDDQHASQGRVKCNECGENKVAFLERYCIGCGDGTKIDATTGFCTPCPSGHITVVSEPNGSIKPTTECVKCANGYHPSTNGTFCLPCHPSFPNRTEGQCLCPENSHTLINGVCFSNAEISEYKFDKNSLSQYKIEYSSGQKVESTFFRENLQAAYLLCKTQHNTTACQLLANMCTLQLHSYSDESSACTLYRNAVSEPYHHPPPHIPKLYYLNIEAPSLLTRPNLIPNQFDTDYPSKTSDINITLAKVTIDGRFRGLMSLIDMIPCEETGKARKLAQKFGTNFKTSCAWPVQNLVRKYGSPIEFLDPYLSVTTSKETKMYPIPIKIVNFKQRGIEINTIEEGSQWQLVRRFFFVDAVDRTDYGNTRRTGWRSEVSRPIRYLSKVHVGVQLQNSYEPGRIYVPLITLTYEELDKDSYGLNPNVEFSFEVEYYMYMTRSIEDVKIAVGVISSLTIVWAAMQAWSWNRRCGRAYIDINTIANLVICSCGHLADAFFIVTFGASLFWFVFFKKQSAVHILLPQQKQERIITDLLISAFALKIVEVLKLIARQVDIDIFFIDWERPKARNYILPSPPTTAGSVNSNGRLPNGDSGGDGEKSEGSVSIWRTYFIANEWNEIQSTRKIHTAFQVIFTVFLLEICGLKNWGLFWPQSETHLESELQSVPFSTAARFAVGSLVYLVLGAIQWIFRVAIMERFVSNKIQDFVDVCTLANISVFILAANQYGYYIHGRSVHGFSDTCMQTMIEQLNREEEDLCGRRGLLPSTDQQTFLVSVPSSFRTVYNQVLQPLYAGVATNLNTAKARAQLRGMANKMQLNSKPSSTMLNLSVHAYQSMNRFLTAFLEHALSDLDYDVTDKSFFEATFDMEFGDVTQDRAIFYTDNGHSFDSVLFYGNERTLFLFNLYTFIFVEIMSHNFLLAGIITYLVDCLLKMIRNALGKRNIARKTLIDGRFLI